MNTIHQGERDTKGPPDFAQAAPTTSNAAPQGDDDDDDDEDRPRKRPRPANSPGGASTSRTTDPLHSNMGPEISLQPPFRAGLFGQMPPMTTPHASPPSSSPHLTAASPHLTSSPVLAAHPTSSDRYLPRPTFSPTSSGAASYHLGQRHDTMPRMPQQPPRPIYYSPTHERSLAPLPSPTTPFTRPGSGASAASLEYQRRGNELTGAYTRSHGMGEGGIPIGARFPYGLSGASGSGASAMQGAGASAMQGVSSVTSPPPGAHGHGLRPSSIEWPGSAGGSGPGSGGGGDPRLQHRQQPPHHRAPPGQQTDMAWLEMLGLQGQHDPGGRRGG
ncbi:hypothetical protein BD626DRAFT_517736 [Schizophyllum amplum]|uniref:Uncharacterized protein n=1 Tax=Schizophyllum amplum TaxID=97359 RepID=A0A550BW74_9AGAR|nr:hypothetical protein BD626DRAFT_517736 [Auriculariopsis ampla]